MRKRLAYRAGLCEPCAAYWERRAAGLSLGPSCGGLFLFEGNQPDEGCPIPDNELRERYRQHKDNKAKGVAA